MRRDELAEVALGFHGLVMNGGFIQAFAVTTGPLTQVVDAFDLLRLDEAARLVRAGIGLLPDTTDANPAARIALVDSLPDGTAQELEALGDRYADLVSDYLLAERIERYAPPTRRLPRLPRSVPEMLVEYVDTILEHDAATKASQIARANRVFRRNHSLYQHLRATDEGRDEIWVLRHHPHPKVRQYAATHSLPYHPDEAVRILEAMQAAGSHEATWILKGWRNGTLNLD